MRVLVFEAVIESDSPFLPQTDGRVSRTIAIREDQTLEQLHEAFRLAFGWADPHLHCFWLGSRFWDLEAVCYTASFELAEHELGSRIPIAEVKLRKGSRLSYLFDFGDEWRLALKVVETWPADQHSYPMLIDAEGTVPPQYLPLDEDEELADG